VGYREGVIFILKGRMLGGGVRVLGLENGDMVK